MSAYDSDSITLSDIPSSDLSDIASDAGDADPLSGSIASLPPISDNDADAESDLGSIASLYHGVRHMDALVSSHSDAEDLADAARRLVIDEETPRARRVMPLRARAWDQTRSGSSPSRSPARRERRPPRRSQRRTKALLNAGSNVEKKSFYDYLFG